MLAAVSTLAAAILLFSPQLDLAFRSLDLGDDESAARYLDEAASIEPEYFERNNMPYLRGRIAERLGD